jgi:hypothetical protein
MASLKQQLSNKETQNNALLKQYQFFEKNQQPWEGFWSFVKCCKFNLKNLNMCKILVYFFSIFDLLILGIAQITYFVVHSN